MPLVFIGYRHEDVWCMSTLYFAMKERFHRDKFFIDQQIPLGRIDRRPAGIGIRPTATGNSPRA
jgi:hypothetical protein